MSAEENKQLMLRWIDAMNKKDVALLEKMADEVYTEDCIMRDPGFPDMGRGPESVKKFVRQVISDPSDMHITVQDLLADGDKTICRFTVTDTDKATGKPINLLVIAIDRFEDGKIAEEWELGVPGSW